MPPLLHKPSISHSYISLPAKWNNRSFAGLLKDTEKKQNTHVWHILNNLYSTAVQMKYFHVRLQQTILRSI